MGQGLNFSTFIRATARKTNALAVGGASVKVGGNCGVCEQAVPSSPSSATQRYSIYFTTVQFVNGLGLANKCPVH